jgi:hypothetical protein
VLQRREVLGDLHRVIGGDQRGGRRQDELVGLGRDVAQRGGGGGDHERRVVMLALGEDVESDLLGLQRDGDHRLDALGLGGRTAGRRVGRDVADREDPELHLVLQVVESATTASWNRADAVVIPESP